MRKTNIKTPIIFRVALILFCVMLITLNLVGNIYAKYLSSFDGGSSTQIAKFSGGEVRAINNYIIKQDLNAPSIHTGYYKFDVEFEFDIYEADVTKQYTLTLYLDEVASSINIANKVPSFIKPTGNIYDGSDVDNASISSSPNQNVICSVPGVVITVNDKEITIIGELKSGLNIENATVRFSYYLPSEQAKGIESAHIRCELVCEQVD